MEKLTKIIGTKHLRSEQSGSSQIETTTASPGRAPLAMAMQARLKAVILLLERMHLEFSLPTLGDLTLRKKAELWAEHLTEARVPTAKLEECYRRAVRQRIAANANYPFSFADLIHAWESLKKEEQREEEKRRNLNPCPRCLNSQWVVVGSEDGRYQTLPCPNCQPNFYALRRREEVNEERREYRNGRD